MKRDISYYISEINEMLSDAFEIGYKYRENKNVYDLFLNFNNELTECLIYDCSKDEIYKALKAIYGLLSWGKGVLKWKELKLH